MVGGVLATLIAFRHGSPRGASGELGSYRIGREPHSRQGGSQRSHISRRNVAFLCNIQAWQSVYLWKCGRRRCAGRDSQRQRVAPIPRMEWEFYGLPSGRFQVRSVKFQARGAGAIRLRIGDCGLRIQRTGCERVPEAKCAKQTQFGPAGGG
jgi:hypothetical protein